jgi:hypothetical protein
MRVWIELSWLLSCIPAEQWNRRRRRRLTAIKNRAD